MFSVPIVVEYIEKKRISNIAKISVMSPIVINMPTRELLPGDTKNYLV